MDRIVKLLRIGLIMSCSICCALQGKANNILVMNGAITGNDLSQGFCNVQFDLSWENSWRLNGVVNWDAAWVFVKFRAPNGVWQHAYLSNSGHTAPSGSQIDLGLITPGSSFNADTNPVIGAFIRRSSDGSGPFSASGVQLRWNYMQQGIGFNDITEVKVFGIEMIHVNEGAYYLGSGGTESDSFTDGSWTSGNSHPYHVVSENAITLAQNPGSLWVTSNNLSGGSLPAAFPKGYRAFYSMKYEVSQQQFVDFLNCLSRTQQNSRTGTDLSVGTTSVTNRYTQSNTSTPAQRNGIRVNPTISSNAPITFYCDLNGNGVGEEEDDGQWIANNFMNWNDLTAYLDWSGLRPMTEMEFEKACRGPLQPVPDEYPWGTATISNDLYALADSGATNERISGNFSTISGNANHANTRGPMRVGIFSAHPSSTGRITAGASYYGIMELGGNVHEKTIRITSLGGPSSYQGTHGNGTLAISGSTDDPTWLTNGIIYRGQGFTSTSNGLPVSERGTVTFSGIRRDVEGGRGVRTAP